MSFVHLHVHTQYSILDGLSSPSELAAEALRLGQPAIAITDHGVMHGCVDHFHACNAAGIKPIIGMEAYLSPLTRFHRSPTTRKSTHLTLLAANNEGYRNLCKLASIAQIEGFYYKPRIDLEVLETHNEGLIVLSGCMMSELHKLILADDDYQSYIQWMQRVFGDRYYIELQEHDLPALTEANKTLLELGLPLVATNDSHYAARKDATAHDVLLCIQTGKKVADTKRMRFNNDGYYLKSREEMALLFPSSSLDNTLSIAARCNVDLTPTRLHMPKYTGTSITSLRTDVMWAAERVFGNPLPPVVLERIEYELSVIESMGFEDFFLMIRDICNYAHGKGIWYNCRGSANASLVAYVLRITNVNPLEFDLIFERFLNPDRVTLPDVDLDFPDDQRGDVVDYASKQFGSDYVAQILTFGHRRIKSAVRDAIRALDLQDVPEIAAFWPSELSLSEALQCSPDLCRVYATHGELLETISMIKDKIRHTGTHSAGVVVADEPLFNLVPLCRPKRGSSSYQMGIMAQYNMGDIERLGLLKIDFLGSGTLLMMQMCCEQIRLRTGTRYDLDSIPVDDPASFDLIACGDVIGLFQIEGVGMRNIVMRMQPTSLDDIVAAVSLHRPGPIEYIDDYIDVMIGRKPVKYHHPTLEPILRDTYGIIVYQDQIIRILTDIGQFTRAQADVIRRAISKKKRATIDNLRSEFVARANVPERVANVIFDDIVYFCNYGFNKAHAVSYARIAVQTAYLKSRYPLEFMLAMLQLERNNTAKVGLLVDECRRMGIEVLGPDAYKSKEKFTIEGDAIRFGFEAIKGISTTVASEIVANPDFVDIDTRQILERLGAYSGITVWDPELLGVGIDTYEHGDIVDITGKVTRIKLYQAQSGQMAFVTVDDQHDVTIFPHKWRKYSAMVAVGSELVFNVKVDTEYNERLSFLVQKVTAKGENVNS